MPCDSGRICQQHPYPNPHPSLIPPVIEWLVRVARVCSQNKVLFLLVSHIGQTSEAIEAHCLSVLRSTTQDASSELLDLWCITRFRTDRGGKLFTIRTLFPNSGPVAIVDDNPGIVQEFEASFQTAFHIQLPKRESAGRRSYSNIFEATEDIEPSAPPKP